MKKKIVFLCIVFIVAVVFSGCREESYLLLNPYENVDWEEFGRYKANFHTHTTASDGSLHPHQAVDEYHSRGYAVLSITDHDNMNPNPGAITFPWEEFSRLIPQYSYMADEPYQDRQPDELGMVALIGNEFTIHHHVGSYFNDFPGSPEIDVSLDAVKEKGGLAVIFHPGRYDYSDEWYIGHYYSYPMLVGMEVYNQGDKYPLDRELWDRVLNRMMPERPVWGFSNDDMHTYDQIGRNWNILLLPELNEREVRRAMENGNFYFIYSPQGHEGRPASIDKISVDKRRGIIRIDASDYSRIEWVSAGKVIHTGESLDIRAVEDIGSYFRARIYCSQEEAVTKTQPFGFEIR